ncbi:L-histidine N(alpha)-methyltransferase [Pelagibius sp.]|uniref:L-histidine N(alpha)-methyltransferase n=1 Tax=Pelagibius sp. TaxID=1931238 RepID=UPI003B514483
MTAPSDPVLEAESDAASVDRAMLDEVLDGLTAPRKTIASKFFYDARGSQLFDAITELEEYYLTRAETAVLQQQAAELAARIGPGATLVEFGSGSSVKTRILLDALSGLSAYVPIDISGDHLDAAAKRLAADYGLPVIPLHADYHAPLVLPPQVPRDTLVGFFPGSTIGNFEPEEAVAFLTRLRSFLGDGARLLIGADLQKDPARLEVAYDDAKGVTAAFNLNLLERFNRELGGDFDLEAFRHEAHYDVDLGRIEMHLVSLRDQTVTLGGRRIAFAAGETIHTENSYKYTLESFAALARRSGWRGEASWTDPENLFSVHLLIAD